MIAWKQVSAEVLYTAEPLSVVGAADVARFKEMAEHTPRRRLRLCTHAAPADPLHEMLIVAGRDGYIAPHRHLARPESFLVVEGGADAVFFTDDGAVARVVRMGPYGDGGAFYYRIDHAQYHTLLLRTPWLVFIEASLGPFDPSRSQFAPWAPAEGDEAGIRRFREAVEAEVAEWGRREA